MGRKEQGAEQHHRRASDGDAAKSRAGVRAAAAAMEKLRRLDGELAAQLEANPTGLRRRSTDRR